MATVHSCVFPPNLATVTQLDQDHYHLPPSLSPLEPLPPPSPLPWQHAVRLGKGFIAVSCVTGGTLVRTTEEVAEGLVALTAVARGLGTCTGTCTAAVMQPCAAAVQELHTLHCTILQCTYCTAAAAAAAMQPCAASTCCSCTSQAMPLH